MNTGIPQQARTAYARVFEFTTTTKPPSAAGSAGLYTWTVPNDCALVEFFLIGGGGGGGGGGRYATTVNRYGGGGGGSGATTFFTVPAYFFTSPLSLVIGAGGAGGAGATANTTAGGAGTNGTASTISMLGAVFTAAAPGTGPSIGGSNSTGEGTSPQGSGGSAQKTYFGQAGLPGGGGALIGSPRVAAISVGGGSGGYCFANGSYVAGASVSIFGLAGLFDVLRQTTATATYKSGGDGAANSVGGNGAAGPIYGAGGGGGAAADNGFNAGNGGNGAGGYIRITCY